MAQRVCRRRPADVNGPDSSVGAASFGEAGGLSSACGGAPSTGSTAGGGSAGGSCSRRDDCEQRTREGTKGDRSTAAVTGDVRTASAARKTRRRLVVQRTLMDRVTDQMDFSDGERGATGTTRRARNQTLC